MDSLIQYTYSCSNAMFKYLKDNDLDALMAGLSRIESIAIDKSIEEDGYDETEDKTLWFKFGSDDTLATDINDLRGDLSVGSINRQHTLNKFQSVTEDLDPDKELRVYFS